MKPASANWRDVLPIHPAAELLPGMSEQELRELGEDIRKNGLYEGVALLDGKLLDGRNRLDAMQVAGIRLVTGNGHPEWANIPYRNVQGVEPFTYVISKNIHRRHLTAEQKRELIAKLLEARPEASNRQIADLVKASHVTVGTVRAELEGRGQIDHVDSRVDTKGRRQRAHKPQSISRSAVIAAAGPSLALLQPSADDAPDPKAPHQSDPDHLISQFTMQVHSTGLDIMRQIGGACRPQLIERLREVIEELELEVERWAKEAHQREEMPDIPIYRRRSAP